MQQVKTVLCLQDISCVGRCSLSVAVPVLACMGAQCCMLPTAVLSTHFGGFGTPAQQDTTDFALQALAHYKSLSLSFDCVQSGFLANEAQADLVRTAFAQNKNALRIVDPVLGDHGKRYHSIDATMVDAMRAICHEADYITPNPTEAMLLLQENALPDVFTQDMLHAWLDALYAMTSANIVLTGVPLADGTHANAYRTRTGHIALLPYTATGTSYPGTGDLFCALFAGGILRGDTMHDSITTAAKFITCAAQAMPVDADTRFGLSFEPFLPQLLQTESEAHSH